MTLTFTTSCGNHKTTTTVESETDVEKSEAQNLKDKLKIELYQITYDDIIKHQDIIYSIIKEKNSVIIYSPYGTPLPSIEQAKQNNQVFFDQIWNQNPTKQLYITTMKDDNLLEYNQMIEDLSTYYPNITCVNSTNQTDVNQSIEENYHSNQVFLELIKETLTEWQEKGTDKLEQINAKEQMESLKERFKNIDKKDITDGIDKANHYITSTEWYQWLKEKGKKTKEYLTPKVKDAYQKSKPYLNEAKNKATEIGSEVNKQAKQKVKKWLEIEN